MEPALTRVQALELRVQVQALVQVAELARLEPLAQVQLELEQQLGQQALQELLELGLLLVVVLVLRQEQQQVLLQEQRWLLVRLGQQVLERRM